MPTPLLQNFGLFLGMVLGYKRMFHLAGTPQKVDKVHREICFAYFRISPTQFKSEVQLFRLRIAMNAIFLNHFCPSSLVSNQICHRIDGILL